MTSDSCSTHCVNLRVRATLRTPVVADNWLPLDGILLYQRTRDDLGQRDTNVPGASLLAQPKGGEMIGGRIPVAIVHARDWYYRCSWAQWGPHADGVDAWSKRFDQSLVDLVDFNGRRGVVNTSSGTYKGYRVPVYYRSAMWVEWYCVGDKERIEYLLSTVTHIGKKSAQGWGRVIAWEVEQIDEDYSIWRDGQLMRGIPVYHWPRELGAPRKASYGVRPPYWLSSNQTILAMPNG